MPASGERRCLRCGATGLALIAAACIAATTALPQAASAREVLVRKDVRDLTKVERRQFVRAVVELKRVPSPYDPRLSYYDQFVSWHLSLNTCNPLDPLAKNQMNAHNGPVFLPWHRQFLALFEQALKDVSGRRIAIPYWNWTDPESVRAVFRRDFMGPSGDPDAGYAVTRGPFRKGAWPLTVKVDDLQYASSATPYLTRHLGDPDRLPTPADARQALAAEFYDVGPYDTTADPALSFRNALEGWRPPDDGFVACAPDGSLLTLPGPTKLDGELHNNVHIWVGGIIAPQAGGARLVGTMTMVPASVNDPVFFLHHANVDRMWARWQRRHGVHTYAPTSGLPHNNVDDPMAPFEEAGLTVTPKDVESIRGLGYRYRPHGSSREGRTGRRLVCDFRRRSGLKRSLQKPV
jgi:tyrosinase